MYHKLLQDRYLRFTVGLLGSVLLAAAINLFIVPQGLYTGGLYGVCQVIRTLLVERAGLSVPFDLAGLLYLLVNVPLLVLAWKSLGRRFVLRLAVCTVVNSLALSLIPSPATPIIADTLTSCLVGGILAGFSLGIVLTCGCSTGGLDVLGLVLAKRGTGLTVGKFSISFNAVLYAVCALLFSLDTAIYSAIYMVFSSLFVDRGHQQNITVQMIIFTKAETAPIRALIMEKLERGFTCWEGRGGYTDEPIHVLYVCLSKYEVPTIQQALRQLDPQSFSVLQEGVHVGGNFVRHLM